MRRKHVQPATEASNGIYNAGAAFPVRIEVTKTAEGSMIEVS